MRHPIFASLLLLPILCAPLLAQQPPGGNNRGNQPSFPPPEENQELRIRLVFPNDRPAPMRLRSVLQNGTGIPISETYADDSGWATFRVRPGVYRIRVAGPELEEETITDSIQIYPREMGRMEFVRVVPKQAPPTSTQGAIALVDLNVPDKARKEFEKGNRAMQDGKTDKAKGHFEKAIAIYPNYAGAHNNLGVLAMQQKDLETGRASFERALQINDKFANANLNMARIQFMEKKYLDAQRFCEKTLQLDPTNADALFVLANAQLGENKFNEVIATGKKLHAITHDRTPTIHIAMANAYIQQNKLDDGMGEYRQFLKESPSGANSDKVREVLTRMEQQKRTAENRTPGEKN